MKLKPTLKDPMSTQSEKFEKNFKKEMIKSAPDVAHKLNETDNLLTEKEQSLKKKIWSLGKMESLVFSDPKLSAKYEEMAENGEEKYGYHYNETIQNMLFNDYVLNSPQYLQKYKMAIPKEKKRRDKSGINQLKKAGEVKMDATGTKLKKPEDMNEVDAEKTVVAFLVHPEHPEVFAYFPDENYDARGRFKTGYAHIGQHSAVAPNYAAESREASPEEYQELHAELEGQGYSLEVLNGLSESSTAGSAGGAAGYTGYAGPAAFSTKGDLSGDMAKKKSPKAKPISTGFALHETNYLTDPSGFEKIFEVLNEETDADFISRNGSNTYGNVDNMNPENQKIIKKDIQSGKMDSNHNIKDGIALQEKAKSKSQQRFMGMVHAVQKGELSPDEVGSGVEKAADSMSDKDAEDFASTKHKGLPDHVDEYLMRDALIDDDIVDTQPRAGETPFKLQSGKYQYETATYADGRKDIVVYSFGDDVYYDYTKFREAMGIEENNIKEDTETMIQNNGTSMSNKAQATGDMSSEVPQGTQQSGGLNEEEFIPHGSYTISNLGGYEIMLNNSGDAAMVRDAFGSDNPKTSDWLEIEYIPNDEGETEPVIDPNGYNIPLNQVMRISNETMNEDFKLLEEINNELNAFSVHHDKLKKMSEERKTTSQVLNARVGDENKKNFKKDLQHSGTKEIIDVEKELMWKDQQTDVPKNPQKLGADIEKTAIKTANMKSEEALKNVGDSTNDSGDEIPKRNLTSEEQQEVDLYRNGQHSIVYDNEPDKRFVDRQKADQGEFFEMGEKQKKFKAGAPLYNKEEQPVGETKVDKVQFDKNKKPGWSERMGFGSNVKLSESMITGRYRDGLNKSRLLEFNLTEVNELADDKGDDFAVEHLFELDFTGLGNKYLNKSVDKKVLVNESVVKAIDTNKFFTDGKTVFAVKNPVQNLNEDTSVVEKPVISEQEKKMKHLLGYNPNSFVNTSNIKKNRGF